MGRGKERVARVNNDTNNNNDCDDNNMKMIIIIRIVKIITHFPLFPFLNIQNQTLTNGDIYLNTKRRIQILKKILKEKTLIQENKLISKRTSPANCVFYGGKWKEKDTQNNTTDKFPPY